MERRLRINFWAPGSREVRRERQLQTNQPPNETNWGFEKNERTVGDEKEADALAALFPLRREQCFEESVAELSESDRIRPFRNGIDGAQTTAELAFWHGLT